MKRAKIQTIKEVASILKSIYSIVLIIGIVVSVAPQIYPYLLQPWTIEIARIVTPILVAVLISYISVNIVKNSLLKETSNAYRQIHERMRKIADFNAANMQILVFMIGSILIKKGKLEDLEMIVTAIKRLDKLWNAPEALPLVGVPVESFAGWVIRTAKWWNIPFEELCHYLIQELGIERVKRLVPSSEILRIYGKDCLSTWNNLVK